MQTVTIYGASDDLVEVEGDLREEFDTDAVTLLFGNGAVLEVRYTDDGVWRITQRVAGLGTFEKVEAPPDDEGNYSDRVTLSGDLRWIAAAHGLTFHKITSQS